MKTEAVIERLDACIQFMEEVKQFLSQNTEIAPEKTVAKIVEEAIEKNAGGIKEVLTEEAQGTEENPYEELADMTEEELEDILRAYELKLPRRTGKRDHKKALIDAVVKGIEDGVIEVEGEESEPNEPNGQEPTETGEEASAEDNNENSEAGDSAGDDEDSEPTDSQDSVEPDEPEELTEMKQAILEAVEEGKIKPSEMKKWLSAHFKDDPDCSECKGCSKEDTINCYVQTMGNALVDDEGEVNGLGTPYLKGGEVFCCGLPCTETKGKYVCNGHCKESFELEK